MKNALLLLLSVSATVLMAADPKPQATKTAESEPKPDQVKRLGSVTWDLDSHKLIWVVQKGTLVDGHLTAASEERYEISPDEAIMALAEEKRGFDGREATSLHRLLDTLSLYCAQSVVWWDQGEGTPVDTSTKPAKKPEEKRDTQAEPKPIKVGEPQPQKRPYRIPEGQSVARLSRPASPSQGYK